MQLAEWGMERWMGVVVLCLLPALGLLGAAAGL